MSSVVSCPEQEHHQKRYDDEKEYCVGEPSIGPEGGYESDPFPSLPLRAKCDGVPLWFVDK